MILPLLIAMSTATADTLSVQHAKAEGPYLLAQPYKTDSLNMVGKSFNLSDMLKQNKALSMPSSIHKAATRTVKAGQKLHSNNQSQTSLQKLNFSIQTERYTEAELIINSPKEYLLFINSVEHPDKKLSLIPGRTEVTLQVLTSNNRHDTFDVKLAGKNLNGVSINPTGKRPYTMADLMQGEHYRQVKLSPTGKYLVIVSTFTTPDGKNKYSTTVTETETGRVLINRNAYMRMQWGNGKYDRLFIDQQGHYGRELVYHDMESGTEQIIADNLPDGDIRIAPNEEYLIISRTNNGKPSTEGLKRLNEPDDRMPDWRKRNTLWRYDLQTGVMQQLTFGSASVTLADISDNSQHLLLQYNRFDAARRPFDRTTFVKMNAYTGKVDTLLADTTFIANAKLTPDGNKLLVLASPASFGGIGNEVKPDQIPNMFDNRLYLYDPNKQKATPLLPHFNPAVEDYIWARGNGNIYFTATDRTYRSLFSLNPKTGKVTRYELPVGQIRNFSIAHHLSMPKAVFFGNSANRAREMYVCLLNKPQPAAKRIGNIDFDKLSADYALATCHDWQFKTTRGDTIDGFYLLPPDFDASKKYPLIVYYYGGCTPTAKNMEHQFPLHVFAGQGYVVYVPNPSGAIGYGQEFAARHVNTWGKESGDDIIEGTKKFCAEHAFVDPKLIGCIGASYGGFMTQYLQTQTDLFAAAISHAGISNITSYWGGGYWGYTYGECAQYGSFPWNNSELYIKQSPLFNADKIHTPLLLLHGTADTNVPTNESQQLYTALKILGRDVSYIQVEGEDHVIVDFKKRQAWQNAIFAWFAKYLKNDSTWWNSLDL